MKRRTPLAGLVISSAALAACTTIDGSGLATTSSAAPVATTAAAPPPASLVALGDAADCRGGDKAVADLVASLPDHQILMVGDTAYPNGSTEDFENCFGPLYDMHLDRLHAVPGDNDYNTGTADPFFQRLGSAAGAADEGWLSFEVGGWLIVGLNSNCDQIGGCDPASAQYQWLEQTLSEAETPCVLAFMHEPRFTSSRAYQGIPRLGHFYELLYQAGADVLLAGHSHHYERFARLDPSGQPAEDGIANITIGVGGAPFTNFGSPLPGSEVRANDTHGVLELVLSPDGYAWQFLPAGDGELVDSGSDTC